MKLEAPNFTQVPNVIFDYWMPRLKPTSTVLLMFFCRKTFGWHKTSETISKSKLCESTGLTKNTVQAALNELEESGLLKKISFSNQYGDHPNTYKLNIEKPIDASSFEDEPSSNEGGSKFDHPPIQKSGGKFKKETKVQRGKKLGLKGGQNPSTPPGQNLTPQNKDTLKEKRKEKEDVSEPAVRLAHFLFAKLKEINPKILDPNLFRWSQEMQRMLKIDNRSEEEIRKVIDFIVEQHKNPKRDFTWSKAVMSPQKLRQHFASIWVEMVTVPPKNAKEEEARRKQNLIKENHAWTQKVQEKIKPLLERQYGITFHVYDHCVSVGDRSKNFYHSIGYLESGYKDQVEKFLRSRGML